MARFIKEREGAVGQPPGSLVYIGEQPAIGTEIHCISYSKDKVQEKQVTNVEECLPETSDSRTVTWVDIEGLSSFPLIEAIGKTFGVHRLWLEDVLNTDHRPKVDELNDLLFLIVKAVRWDSSTERIEFEQVSLFMGDGFVLSFQEKLGNVLARVKSRIKENKGRIRTEGHDYLMYALVDSLVDDYFLVLETIGHKIENMESEISEMALPDIPERITALKHNLMYLNRAIVPIKESIAPICRSSRSDIKDETKIYFRDAYEHAIQIMDAISDYRQMLNSLMEFYQSQVDSRLNEIMKTLTIFASLFIPLTFIAGIFGMNFENMPELKWQFGYFYTLGFMLVVAIGMLMFFKRKRWF